MNRFENLINLLTENVSRTKLVVEAFDPKRAEAAGIDYKTATIDGIEVVLTSKRGTGGTDDRTVIINQQDIIDASSSFCDYNPQINHFARQNPENMFYVLGLVVGTVGSSWVQFRNLYPVYAAFIRETDGADIPVDSIVGLDGEETSVKRWFYKGASKYIKGIWNQKDELYHDIYEKDIIDDEYELYKYILHKVSGMATVKAAFAVQLLTGKLGCIDNINADIYGIPVSITDPSGKQIKAPAFSKKGGVKTDELSKAGQKIVQNYIDFLKAIGKVSDSPYSQRLWDDWVQLAAAKSVFADSHNQIQFNLVDGRKIVMPTYKNATNDKKYAEFLDKMREQGIDPFGGYQIGKDHFDVPHISGEIDDPKSRVK